MERPIHFIGVDISADTFNAAEFTSPGEPRHGGRFENGPEGFDHLLRWFEAHGVQKESVIICIEGTGVYGERLSYFLHAMDTLW